VLRRGYKKFVGEHGHRGIGLDQCRLRGIWPQIWVRAVFMAQPREVPQGKLGVVRKVARHGGQNPFKPRDRNYFLNCGVGP